jgi:hypothetical protein
MTDERATKEKTERRRQRGSNVLSGIKLGVDPKFLDEKNFAYRWINDNGGRIDQMTKADDWDLVRDPTKTGKPDSDGEGSLISKVVGRGESGQPMKAFLAKKPRNFYEEDQADKKASIDKTMESIKRGTPQTEAPGLGASGYVPGGPGGIQINNNRS